MKTDFSKLIEEMIPDFNWKRFHDIDRALNWELLCGPLGVEYWTEVEPLEHYVWRGWKEAENDLKELADELPSVAWVSDNDNVTFENPDDDPHNWGSVCKYCGADLWWQDCWVDIDEGDCCSGNDDLENENGVHEPEENVSIWSGEDWYQINPVKEVMHAETYNQLYR